MAIGTSIFGIFSSVPMLSMLRDASKQHNQVQQQEPQNSADFVKRAEFDDVTSQIKKLEQQLQSLQNENDQLRKMQATTNGTTTTTSKHATPIVLEPSSTTATVTDDKPTESVVNKEFDYRKRSFGQTEPMKDQDMNIVLFYADDWTYKTLGMVNPIVKTPNIDTMARNGMLFQQNCVTTSICWISRATLYTGQYAGRHQHLLIPSTNMFNHTVWPKTLYPQLKKAGYHVGFVGKWHHKSDPDAMNMAFDHRKFYYGNHWMDQGTQKRHVTDLNREDAIHYLQKKRPKGKKFALTVSFFATHAVDHNNYPDQFQPQPTSEHRYDDIQEFPIPKTATLQHWKDLPWFFEDRNEARARWKKRFKTPVHYQDTIRKLYRMATEVDDAIGAVIDELKRQGVYNNTLIIFTTDNGMYHGEHGLAGKWYPHEESIRVPLVIQDPRMSDEVRGTTNDEFTLSIDLAPTILAAAGITIPDQMQGQDMARMYLDGREEAIRSWRKDFFYEWETPEFPRWFLPEVYSLVSKEYKYILWPQTGYEQLFHMRDDPWEESDIHNSTLQTNPEMLAKMKERFAYLMDLSKNHFPP